MHHYQIGDINLCVQWENENKKNKYYRYHDCIILPRSFAAFYNERPPRETDMNVWVRELSEDTGPEKCKKIYNQSFYLSGDKMVLLIRDPFDEELPGYSMVMSKDYSHVEYIPHRKEYEHYDLQWLMYPFEGRVLYKSGVVLHGAAIECNGKGIIFTGISGAGKSTQAHLWQKYRDAFIINGDCPMIKMLEGIPMVYGTPWCGSSGEFINRKVALSAIVVVKQGEKSSLKELEGNTAFLGILANVLRSNFDENSLNLAIENLNSMMKHIRVFELTGTISEASVEILENQMM